MISYKTIAKVKLISSHANAKNAKFFLKKLVKSLPKSFNIFVFECYSHLNTRCKKKNKLKNTRQLPN